MNNLTPEIALQDLENYLSRSNRTLSKEAFSIILSGENIAYKEDISFVTGEPILYGALLESKAFRDCVVNHGGNCDDGVKFVCNHFSKTTFGGEKYSIDGVRPYSSKKDREYRTTRTRIADYALAMAKRNANTVIHGNDIVSILLDIHDEDFPIMDNVNWVDSRLQVDFNTVSHIVGRYHKSLWIKFQDVRSDLGLLDPKGLQRFPIENAPLEVRPSLMRLLNDFPDFSRNAFLIMPFRQTKFHTEIYESISTIARDFGINLLRADRHNYSDDLLTNILSYIHGSRFGIAVYERILDDYTNPNVAFEVGYMMGLKKPVCLLKESTMKSLHTDLVGRVYVEFMLDNLSGTLKDGIERWLKDKRLPYQLEQ